MKLHLSYFAGLRDQAGRADEEVVVADETSLTALYATLQARHGFALPAERLRVAIDDAFVTWDVRLFDGARVVFIPPVSGG